MILTHHKQDVIISCKMRLKRQFMNYKTAFTLAEVLITLGIIGVVASITLPAVITHIQNKGFVEGLKKNYAVIQAATSAIIAEEGSPKNWNWTTYKGGDTGNSGNQSIVNLYKKHLIVAEDCGLIKWNQKLCGQQIPVYKYLNGETNATFLYNLPPYTDTYTFILQDGSIIAVGFKVVAIGMRWGTPDISFTIDVNGLKGPNIIGRDVFIVYMDKNKQGKILPYTNEVFIDGPTDNRNTCDKSKSGYSCAYRVISENKMNY